MSLGFHLMFRADDDRVLAPSPSARRRLARAVYRVAAPFPMLAFGAADNHLHVVVLAERPVAADLARRLPSAVRPALALSVPFAPVRNKELVDQAHSKNAFHYALRQREHHGVGPDPFLDATSLPELLGLRLLPTDTLSRVREHLPRLTRADLLAHLGLKALEPVTVADLEPLAMDEATLLDAAAAALALPALSGREAETVRAHAALVQVLSPALPPGRIAAILDRDGSRVRRLRALPLPPALLRAVRLQLALRAAAEQATPTEPPTR